MSARESQGGDLALGNTKGGVDGGVNSLSSDRERKGDNGGEGSEFHGNEWMLTTREENQN